MLTDLALRNLKPRAALYKVADRDGMYAAISPSGAISFRYDYRLNGRRETLTIGRYGFVGISLAAAREKLRNARRLVGEGISPALQKQREKCDLEPGHTACGGASQNRGLSSRTVHRP
jgi:hypothetical protein